MARVWNAYVLNYFLILIHFFYQTMNCPEQACAQTESVTAPRLILIQFEMDHKNGQVLPHNTTTFPRLELKTTR